MRDQSRPLYDRPILARHQTGLMNKFSRVGLDAGADPHRRVNVQTLVEAYGSPSSSSPEDHRRRHASCDAFARRFRRCASRSYNRPNYLDAICRVLHRERLGRGGVEFEWERRGTTGCRAGASTSTGRFKTEGRAPGAPEGTPIHIDNFDELALLERLADEPPRSRRRSRCGSTSRWSPPLAWSRFGFKPRAARR
nr:hypothetical protein [Deltaproteobacteria bacterium]